VVAFAEHSGGGGGSVAAPIVREVMESYFKGDQ
jgi:penicillin-binding protein 2